MLPNERPPEDPVAPPILLAAEVLADIYASMGGVDYPAFAAALPRELLEPYMQYFCAHPDLDGLERAMMSGNYPRDLKRILKGIVGFKRVVDPFVDGHSDQISVPTSYSLGAGQVIDGDVYVDYPQRKVQETIGNFIASRDDLGSKVPFSLAYGLRPSDDPAARFQVYTGPNTDPSAATISVGHKPLANFVHGSDDLHCVSDQYGPAVPVFRVARDGDGDYGAYVGNGVVVFGNHPVDLARVVHRIWSGMIAGLPPEVKAARVLRGGSQFCYVDDFPDVLIAGDHVAFGRPPGYAGFVINTRGRVASLPRLNDEAHGRRDLEFAAQPLNQGRARCGIGSQFSFDHFAAFGGPPND